MDQLGVLVANELNKVYIDEKSTLTELKDRRIEPRALIFGYPLKGTATKLYKLDITQQIRKVDDVPLDTPVYEVTDHLLEKLKKGVYQGWYYDDGVNIRPLRKETIPALTELINIQYTDHPTHVSSLVTYV